MLKQKGIIGSIVNNWILRHLCETCKYEQPDCEAVGDDIQFGEDFGIPNADNVVTCTCFDGKYKD